MRGALTVVAGISGERPDMTVGVVNLSFYTLLETYGQTACDAAMFCISTCGNASVQHDTCAAMSRSYPKICSSGYYPPSAQMITITNKLFVDRTSSQGALMIPFTYSLGLVYAAL